MQSRTGVGLMQLGARVLLLLLLSSTVLGQAGKDGASHQPEEQFKAIDPYTKGDPEAVRRAGYKSLQAVPWATGIQPQDMVEVLGGIELLWAETEHFKICSSLQTYKGKGDSRENEALDKELILLATRMPAVKAAHANKLDPWLRLHLYAMRLERLYTEFCERTGFSDSEFPSDGKPTAMGSGPYLGQKLKPTILLAEKSSALGRFNRRFGKVDDSKSQRFLLPGGLMFFGISAESMRDNGYELDAALHCAVVECVVSNLLDGLRDSYWATPLWFDVGLGHWFSRRVDERYSYYADGTTRYLDDKTHEWQPRVRGLLVNKFAYSWDDMLGTLEWSQFTPQSHMLIWSRVDWIMQHKPTEVRKFLEPLTVTLPTGSAAAIVTTQLERTKVGLAAGFGKSPAECEAAWSAWVLKTYAKN